MKKNKYNYLIDKSNDDGRLDLIDKFLESNWEKEVVDFQNLHALEKKVINADAIITMSWDYNLNYGNNLKLIQLPGAGVDEINFNCIPKNISVCNVYEHEIPISEFVLTGMLNWVSKFIEIDENLKRGNWFGSFLFGPRHNELYEKTIGVVGYGKIGKEVWKRCKSFGMKLFACNKSKKKIDSINFTKPMDDIEKLYAVSDFILLSLPLNSDTKNLINLNSFKLMKKNAFLINVSRGGIINENDLYTALSKKIIGGALIDTWNKYPTNNSGIFYPSELKFHQLNNIYMSSHASAWTEQLKPRRNKIIASNLNRLANGKKLSNVVA
jgi:phosphoglycerate dehydrogenase-like enzyme